MQFMNIDSDIRDFAKNEYGPINGVLSVDDDNHNDNDHLTKCQQGLLELFIAQIRLRSQKMMKYWAMIPPLASHSHGHMHNPLNHPLHGVGCSTTTMWNTLNQLFDFTANPRANVITNQYMVSMAFDNWQSNIQKVWQTGG